MICQAVKKEKSKSIQGATMELKITYTHFDIRKVSSYDELEGDLKACLAENGFKLTDDDFDFDSGQRTLSFINEEWLSKFEEND